jgi:hypothetical protein
VFNKVAVAAIVGNEDGAHHVTAELFQALNDVGWTIPAMASCYWVGEAMHKTDFQELHPVPGNVCQLAAGVAASAAHLAGLLSALRPAAVNPTGQSPHMPTRARSRP